MGDIVPVALPGSTIASGMTLKQASLRGGLFECFVQKRTWW